MKKHFSGARRYNRQPGTQRTQVSNISTKSSNASDIEARMLKDAQKIASCSQGAYEIKLQIHKILRQLVTRLRYA
jgi:hypothetical protein